MSLLVRLVVVLVIAAQVMPGVAVVGRHKAAMGDSCPMMAHQLNEQPCIGTPCPCDHGSDGELQLTPAAPGVFAIGPTLLSPLVSTGPSLAAAVLRRGHPFQVDHPPTL